MHPIELRNKLSGVIAFPITPFKDDLTLDLPGLHHNLTKLLEHSVSAVVAVQGLPVRYYSLHFPNTRSLLLNVPWTGGFGPVNSGVMVMYTIGVVMAYDGD